MLKKKKNRREKGFKKNKGRNPYIEGDKPVVGSHARQRYSENINTQEDVSEGRRHFPIQMRPTNTNFF